MLGGLEGVTGVLGMDAMSVLQVQIDTARRTAYPGSPSSGGGTAPQTSKGEKNAKKKPASQPAPRNHPAPLPRNACAHNGANQLEENKNQGPTEESNKLPPPPASDEETMSEEKRKKT